MHLDKQHPTPVYIQLKKMLQTQIEQGVYSCHQKLPSERDLCQHYSLSRMTARRALQELIAEGFAYTRAGKGTFVSQIPNLLVKKLSNGADQSGIPKSNSSVELYYKQRLIEQLLSFNCLGIEQAINEALATHSLEMVTLKLFPDVIRQLEQRWQKGEVNLAAHNYAINTLYAQLVAMFNAATKPERGPKILLACAPEDYHEMGLLTLALKLRWRGFQAIYLGTNVAMTDFDYIIDLTRPQLICFSAATTDSTRGLARLSQKYQSQLGVHSKQRQQTPLFTFGGVAFNQNPTLITSIRGLYLGSTIEAAVEKIQNLLPGMQR